MYPDVDGIDPADDTFCGSLTDHLPHPFRLAWRDWRISDLLPATPRPPPVQGGAHLPMRPVRSAPGALDRRVQRRAVHRLRPDRALNTRRPPHPRAWPPSHACIAGPGVVVLTPDQVRGYNIMTVHTYTHLPKGG